MRCALLTAPIWPDEEGNEPHPCHHELILLVTGCIFCKLFFCNNQKDEQGIAEPFTAAGHILGVTMRQKAALSTVWCSGCLTAKERVLPGHSATEVKVNFPASMLQSTQDQPLKPAVSALSRPALAVAGVRGLQAGEVLPEMRPPGVAAAAQQSLSVQEGVAKGAGPRQRPHRCREPPAPSQLSAVAPLASRQTLWSHESLPWPTQVKLDRGIQRLCVPLSLAQVDQMMKQGRLVTDILVECGWSRSLVSHLLCIFHDEMIFAAPWAVPVSLPPPCRLHNQ